MTIHLQETFLNATEGNMIGEGPVYDSGREPAERGRLFRDLAREYGRCKSKMYIDTTDGASVPIGWVFESRDRYQDSEDTYLREVWVTLHEKPPTHTVENHYLVEGSA